MTNLEAYKNMSLEDVLGAYNGAVGQASLGWRHRPDFVEWLNLDYTAPVPPMLRICDKIRDRHKAIYDCRNYFKRTWFKINSSKQDDVMCQTIYWLYDERPEAEVHYEDEKNARP